MEFPITEQQLRQFANDHGTPAFVYSQRFLQDRARVLTSLSAPYGLTPRYAAKANNHPDIIRLLDEAGLSFDASSSYEAEELIDLGIDGARISLSSQQPAHNLSELLQAGVQYIATSLRQLELFAASCGETHEVGLRVNPGMGSGHNNRTTTGGANSSFGLWHEYVPRALAYARAHGFTVSRLHVHVGSGADPSVWARVMDMALAIVRDMPDVTTLDIGGGYKVHRYGEEQEADIAQIVQAFSDRLEVFAGDTGRELSLEIEPGTWLAAHCGVLLAEIVDVVDTGRDGHTFLRLNTGMNDILRPSMYGAQHTIRVLNDMETTDEYVVVGHNCETGDILTPATGDPEGIAPRMLRTATIGDVVAIYDTGAYCRSMSAHGYNSYPSAQEYMI